MRPPIKAKSITDQAYDYIRNAILTGDLTAGIHLNEGRLAEETGTSRLPIREALQRLSYEGLVELQPRRGAFVASLGRSAAAETLDITGALLGLAVVRTVEFASGDDVCKMRARHDEVRALIESATTVGYPHHVFDLHLAIVAAAEAPLLAGLLEQLGTQIKLIRLHSPLKATAADGLTAWEEHDRILRAIEARDAEAARIATVEHLHNVKRRLLDRMGAAGDLERTRTTGTGEEST